MHPLFFAGLLYSLAVVLLLSAGFFVHAWRYRQHETESLLFGLATLFFALYAAAAGQVYSVTISTAAAVAITHVDIAVGATIVAVALLMHFGLRYARSRRERPVMAVVYAAATAFLVLLISGHWWTQTTWSAAHLQLLGLRIPVLQLAVTPMALAYHLLAPLGLALVSFLLGRDYLRGRRESRPAFLGSLVMTATAINDALALGTGWLDTVPLLPLGCVAMVYGAIHSLLSHYGQLSSELQEHTETLAQRSEQLAESMRERERTQEELVQREQLAMIGELTGVIAEQIRAPLKTVNQAARKLHQPAAETSDPPALLETIEVQLASLDELVTNLLHFARPIALQHEQLDLKQLLERSLATVEGGENVQCRIDCELPWPALTGDPELLEQALSNLIRNGMQAMGRDGELAIRIMARQVHGIPCTTIELSDTGEGMTVRQCDEAMAPFVTTRAGLWGWAYPSRPESSRPTAAY
jgi:signal transduction histidine kinase